MALVAAILLTDCPRPTDPKTQIVTRAKALANAVRKPKNAVVAEQSQVLDASESANEEPGESESTANNE